MIRSSLFFPSFSHLSYVFPAFESIDLTWASQFCDANSVFYLLLIIFSGFYIVAAAIATGTRPERPQSQRQNVIDWAAPNPRDNTSISPSHNPTQPKQNGTNDSSNPNNKNRPSASAENVLADLSAAARSVRQQIRPWSHCTSLHFPSPPVGGHLTWPRSRSRHSQIHHPHDHLLFFFSSSQRITPLSPKSSPASNMIRY